jgi:hypothetical protein
MYKNITSILIFFIIIISSHAQCPAGTWNNTGFFIGFDIPSQPGIANESTAAAAWGGDYYLFNVVNGNTYVFRTCFTENTSINTVLSLYNANGTTLITFNDDFCGQQSQISWTANFTGQVRLSYYQSGCATAFIDTKIGVYYTTPCSAPIISSNPSSSTTCTSTNTSFTINASGTSLNYQWQQNTGSGFSNITNGGVYSNATTATLNLTGAYSAMSGTTYRCIVSNTCGSINSNAATLTVNPNNWIGSSSNNWSTAANWSCGIVPSSLDDVTISTGTPTVTSASSASCRNLTKTGILSTLNLSGATLNVFGDLAYNSGTITTTATSNINFSSSGLQNLSGTNFSTATISKSVGGTLNINSNVSITNSLNINAGIVNINALVVFKSNASTSAYIGTINGQLIGSLNIEKYIPGKRAFRFLAHPFSADTSIFLNALTTAFNITGIGGSTNGFTTTTTNSPSAFYYNNTIAGSGNGSNDLGWQAFTNTNTGSLNRWNSYQGIRVLIRGSLGEGLNGLPYTPSATTLTIRGFVNTGTQVIPVTRSGTNGFNFIGNPYPAPVDVNATARTNVGSSFYVWDATLGTSGQYRNIAFGSSYVIPAYAGFFVNATAIGSIVFSESNKSTAATNNLFRTADSKNNKLILKLSTDSIVWDYHTLFIDADAVATKDYWDGEKLFNGSVNLYSLSTDKYKLSIDSRNATTLQEIDLGINTANVTNFNLTVDELLKDKNQKFYLKDKYLDTIVELKKGINYTFFTTQEPLSKGENRFSIIQLLENKELVSLEKFQMKAFPNPTANNLNIQYTLDKEQTALINITNTEGKSIVKRKIINAKIINEIFFLNRLPSGIYTIELNFETGKICQQLFKL